VHAIHTSLGLVSVCASHQHGTLI